MTKEELRKIIKPRVEAINKSSPPEMDSLKTQLSEYLYTVNQTSMAKYVNSLVGSRTKVSSNKLMGSYKVVKKKAERVYKNMKYIEQGQMGFVDIATPCYIGTGGLGTCVGLVLVTGSKALVAHLDGHCELFLDEIIDQITMSIGGKINKGCIVNNNLGSIYKNIDYGYLIIEQRMKAARLAARNKFNIRNWSDGVFNAAIDASLNAVFDSYNKMCCQIEKGIIFKDSTHRLCAYLRGFFKRIAIKPTLLDSSSALYNTRNHKFSKFQENNKSVIKARSNPWQRVDRVVKISMYNGDIVA